jgi:hypothetical protein
LAYSPQGDEVKRTPVLVLDEAEGQEVVVGYIRYPGFYRTVRPDRDMLATRKAYALHDSVIDQLVDAGVEWIVLQEPARRLTSLIEDWQELGNPYVGPRGVQTSLAVNLMVEG